MATGSLLILVTTRSVRILLECFLVSRRDLVIIREWPLNGVKEIMDITGHTAKSSGF